MKYVYYLENRCFDNKAQFACHLSLTLHLINEVHLSALCTVYAERIIQTSGGYMIKVVDCMFRLIY